MRREVFTAGRFVYNPARRRRPVLRERRARRRSQRLNCGGWMLMCHYSRSPDLPLRGVTLNFIKHNYVSRAHAAGVHHRRAAEEGQHRLTPDPLWHTHNSRCVLCPGHIVCRWNQIKRRLKGTACDISGGCITKIEYNIKMLYLYSCMMSES